MKLIPFSLVATVLFVTSCSTLSVSHHFDPSVDLAGYESFALLPIPHSPYDEIAQAVLGVEDLSRGVAVAVLEQKGYRKVEEVAVDFFLGMRVEIRSDSPLGLGSVSSQASGLVFGAWDGAKLTKNMGEPIRVYEPSKEGRFDPSETFEKRPRSKIYLMVEVFDAKSRNLIWQGWAAGGSERDFSGDSQRVQTVERILRDFPN